jgi:hypothetical protein
LTKSIIRVADDDLCMCPKFVPGEPLRARDRLILREKIW